MALGAPMQSAPDLGLMQAQLNQLTGQLGLQGQMGAPSHMAQAPASNGFSGGSGDINSAVAEIARRQQMLNQGSAPNHAVPPVQPQPTQTTQPVDTIGQDLAELKKELG